MSIKHSVKRGISLYSYQEEYFLRKLTLEQCIAKASAIGALGIETLAEQMMRASPPVRRLLRPVARLDGEVRHGFGLLRHVSRHQIQGTPDVRGRMRPNPLSGTSSMPHAWAAK